LESANEQALTWELGRTGLRVEWQLELPVRYKGVVLTVPLRLDLMVEGLVIVECKAAMAHHSVFEAQLPTRLRVTGLHLGPLVNFGFPVVSRVVNRLKEAPGERPEIRRAGRSEA
jgi:GxxExxY protein